MSFEPVDVYVVDTTPQKNPIEGVVVKVMNQSGTLSYHLLSTDADGKVSFLLEAPNTYQLRFFKRQVNIKNPVMIEVLEAPNTNVFEVSGEVFLVPVSSNPRLCMASGYFLQPDGSPAANVDIHFIAKFKPVLLENDAVMTERVIARTNKQGYAELTLIRFGQYNVTIEGFEDYQRCIEVPDLPNVNLPDLLFPRVYEIVLDPEGPYTLAVDDEIVVTPTVITSDGRALEGTATADVVWSSSDNNVLAVLPSATTITLRGIGAGAAQLKCERLDTSIIRIPNTPIIGQPVAVTVT